MGPPKGHRPTGAFTKTTHTRICQSGQGCSHINGKVGHKRWVLAAQLPPRRRMEFLQRLATRIKQAAPPCGPKLTANGVGQISTVFLRSMQNGKRCCNRVLRNTNWNPSRTQVQAMGWNQQSNTQQHTSIKGTVIHPGSLRQRLHLMHNTNTYIKETNRTRGKRHPTWDTQRLSPNRGWHKGPRLGQKTGQG